MFKDATRKQQYQTLRKFIEQSYMGDILASVEDEDSEALCQWYLNDFVKTVHKHTHKNQKTGKKELEVK